MFAPAAAVAARPVGLIAGAIAGEPLGWKRGRERFSRPINPRTPFWSKDLPDLSPAEAGGQARPGEVTKLAAVRGEDTALVQDVGAPQQSVNLPAVLFVVVLDE